MELIEGQNLKTFCAREGPQETLKVLLQLLSILRRIYECGSCHNDIHAGNVCVVHKNGEAKAVVLDFGSSYELSQEEAADPGHGCRPVAQEDSRAFQQLLLWLASPLKLKPITDELDKYRQRPKQQQQCLCKLEQLIWQSL